MPSDNDRWSRVERLVKELRAIDHWDVDHWRKEFRGKSRIAQLGFWVGGNPAYGYRRLMLSANGTPRQSA